MLKKKLRLCLSLAVYAWDKALGILKPGPGTCVVLYYHEVSANDRERFAAQLDLLCKHAVPVSALNPQALKAGRRYVAVTVDDAFVSFCQNGFPELVKRKMPVVVFVPTAYLGRKVEWGMEEVMVSNDEQIITTAELQALAKHPLVQIGSHTANHRNLTLLNDAEAMNELSESKRFLEQTLGCVVNSISFPYGAFGPRHLELASAAGYQSCFTTSPARLAEKIDAGLIGRVRVDPCDSTLEFKLKSSGAYRWQVAVGKIKRGCSLLRRRFKFFEMESSSNFQVSIDAIKRLEWNTVLGEFDDATIQQTWDYGAVCWGKDQLSHFVLKRNDAVVAMAQVRLVRVPVIGKGIAYLRWGPLCRRRGESWNDDAFHTAMDALVKEYCERRGLVLRILPNAFQTDAHDATIKQYLDETGFVLNPEILAYRTMRMDLTQSEENLRKALSQRWRSYLKKAENTADYFVREGSSDEFYALFARAYDEMMSRKKFETTVDIKEIGRIHSSLPEALKLHILICEQGGQLLNALVISLVGDTPVYLLAAQSHAGLNGRGAFLLQWRAMMWMKQRGFKWYDLGGTDPNGNPGVYQFKSGMGGEEVLQRGAFDFSKDSLSSLCVAAGEKLQAFKHRLKKSSKPESTAVVVEEKSAA